MRGLTLLLKTRFSESFPEFQGVDMTGKAQTERIGGKRIAGKDIFHDLTHSHVSHRENQRHVKRMGYLKIIFPALTICALIALVLWPLLSSRETSFTLAVDRLDKKDEKAKLIKPKYMEVDRYGNPVNIWADQALVKENDQQDYYLINLLANMKLQNKDDLKIKATSGIFHVKEQVMMLDGSVKITTQSGFRLQTAEAEFLINDKIARGNKGVQGTAPFGQFSSNVFHANIDQGIIRLDGNVKIHFDPRKPMEIPLDIPSIDKLPVLDSDLLPKGKN